MNSQAVGLHDPAFRAAEVVDRAAALLFGIRATVALAALHSYPYRTLPVVASAMSRIGVTPSAPPVSVVRPDGDGAFEVTAGYPTTEPVRIGLPFVIAELPAGRAVQTLHAGPWSTMLFAYDRLSEWLAGHGVTAVSLMWEEYLVGPEKADDAASWRTRVVVPLPAAPAEPRSHAGSHTAASSR